jgi:hypothetical protein
VRLANSASVHVRSGKMRPIVRSVCRTEPADANGPK